MFGALQAKLSGAEVTLLERSDRLGRKLAITGKGRCNLTNSCAPREALQNIPRGGKFLTSAMYAFPPEQVMAFFESQGVPLKVERGRRVFPVSDRAADVVGCLKTALHRAGVAVQQARAESLLLADGVVRGVRTDRGDFAADAVILATGGLSYPLTGSTGDGYRMAEQAGHHIVEPTGSLVPLTEAGDWCRRMQGLSLRNVGVRLEQTNGKLVYEDFGELLFTHFGLSGPTVLSASAHMQAAGPWRLAIDLKPALDEKTLDQRLVRDFTKYRNRDANNALADLFPQLLIPVMLARAEIDPTTKANALTRAQRHALLANTKRFCVEIAGKRPVEEAIVTSGGVDTREIDPRSMGSRLVRGLYFAGEVMDCDGYTGGYNLQIAWATGHMAGRAAAQQEEL